VKRWRGYVRLRLALWVAAGAAAAGAVAAPAIAALPPAVSSTFPLGIAGLATNADGTHTLWVLDTQQRKVVVDGSSIFAVTDLIFTPRTGGRTTIRPGSYCSQTEGASGPIECLPTIQPGGLAPVLTFESSKPYSVGAGATVELNSPSEVTVAPLLALPRGARTPAAVRRFLVQASERLHRSSTTVFVTAGKPRENGFTLSSSVVPAGWITFVVTNRGAKYHGFQLCPNSGLANECKATIGGASVFPEIDDTGSLAPGRSAYFTAHLEPGRYEYLSDVIGQPAKGAKGQIRVR